MRQAVEQYATVMTCLVEFNSIEQALALQDEDDREGM
jgi:copper chaperone CopZ